MERLKQPITRVLFNSIDKTKVGVHDDNILGKRILQLKELGISFPGDDAVGGTSALSASGTLHANLEVAKAATDDGIKKGWLVNLNPMAPAQDSYWGFGLTIRPKVKMPGVRNNRHQKHEKSYGGTIKAITSTNGYVDDTYVLSAEDDIIKQIYLDGGAHDVNPDPISNMSKAVCNPYRAYIVTTNSGDAITYTDEDGNATAVNAGASTEATANTINANATIKLFVKAIAINATQVLIMSRTAGTLFTISVAGSNVIDGRYIMLEAKSELVQFDVELATSEGSLSAYSRFVITGTTAAGTTTVTVDGTDYGPANDAATTTYADNLIAALTSDGYASYDGYGDGSTPQWDVWFPDTTESVQFTFSATSTSELTASFSYFAKFPSLTSDDIHRIFANNKGQAGLNSFVYGDNAIDGEDYYKYTLTYKGDVTPSQHGASTYETHRRTLELYVRASAAVSLTSMYDADAPNTQYNCTAETGQSTPDLDFEDLLGIWSGLVVSSW